MDPARTLVTGDPSWSSGYSDRPMRVATTPGSTRSRSGCGLFDVLPDNLCAKIASFVVHAKSLVALRSTCSYLRRVVHVGGALVFLAEDFPQREAAERGITQALLQASAAVTSLYVEAPPASDPFQELAVMAWCMACRETLEELTLVDGSADARLRRRQALAASMDSASASAAAALAASASAPSVPAAAAAAAASNGAVYGRALGPSSSVTTAGTAAAAAGAGSSERGSHHALDNSGSIGGVSSGSNGNGNGNVNCSGIAAGGSRNAAAALIGNTASARFTPFYPNASSNTNADEEEGEEPEEEPQEWKLEHASRCHKLRQLYLENAVFDCVSSLHFASLRHLTLAKVVVGGDMLCDLLACCPRLEELVLLLCSGIGPLDLMHAPCAALKRFEVRLSNRAARKDACLELLRLNAPNLEDLELEVDWAPEGRLEHELWGDIRIELGDLRRMSLELAAGFNFHANPGAFSRLTVLTLTGDDWSWGTVRAILDLCALSLEELSLTCFIDQLSIPSIDTATVFFSSLPSLRFVLLCPFIFYIMLATLGDTTVIRAPSLEEFHLEYHDHAMAVIPFLAALLRGSPRLRCIQPMLTVPQEPGTDLLGDKDFRRAIAQLQAEFPRVSFPSIWQLT
ncbi:hypothetical protein CLOM_g11975 [Closterium sp. NIES-68]|nr:hypothetical protein CLOM_g11975 [Closterium sp. NIES-68]